MMLFTMFSLAVLIALFGMFLGNAHVLTLLAPLIGAALFGSSISNWLTIAFAFPPELRATGLGLCSTAGRVGSIFGPIVGGALLNTRSTGTFDLFGLSFTMTLTVTEGTVDLALGYFPDLCGSGFLTQTLFSHSFTCIARRDHSLARPGWSIEDFLSLSHIVVAQRGRSQELFEERLAKLGLERRIQLHSPHFMSVPMLVSRSDLISTVPAAVGEAFATMAPLQLLKPPMDSPLISIQQFWHRRVHDDRAVRWLRALVTRLFLNQDPPMRI